MGTLRKLLVVVGIQVGMMVLSQGVADAKPVRVGVTAMGTGTDSDKGSAQSAAKDSAKASLVCAGRLEEVDANVSGCVQTGSGENKSFICTAVARGTCVIGG